MITFNKQLNTFSIYYNNMLNKIVRVFLRVFKINQNLEALRQEEQSAVYRARAKCGDNVTFGKDAILYNLANNPSNIIIGKDALIEGELIVHKYGGYIKVGEHFYLGRNSRIWSGESVEIGDHVLVSHNVGIVDTNVHELDAIERSERQIEQLKNGPWATKGAIVTAPVKIGSHVWINFNVIILKGVSIGDGAIIAAGSIVTQNVDPYTLVAGVPARFIKKLEQSEREIS